MPACPLLLQSIALRLKGFVMQRTLRVLALAACYTLLVSPPAWSQNWPQWRGPNRDAKATGFKTPTDWPKELSQKWKVSIGDGVATPALVDDKLFVFGRIGGNEVVRALNGGTGDELWKDEYPAEAPRGAASGFPGPRSSPTYAEGKLVTLGVHGTLTCYDAATGAKLWRKDSFGGGLPRFATSSSPIVVDGLCIAQLGSDNDGGIVAYDLASGDEKWKWTGDGTAYASPTLLTIDGAKAIVAVTAKNLVALNATDGKKLWQIPYVQGRYNSTSPIVIDSTVIYAGPTRGMTAVELAKQGDELAKKEGGWRTEDNSLMYNTPVLRDGHLYGITNLNAIFCANAKTGESTWSSPIAEPGAAPADAKKGDEKGADTAKADDSKGDTGKGEGRKGGKGGRRGGGGGGGYGSVVDAGKVLVALNPTGQLIFFEPSPSEFKQLALYKVADGGTYAYPILSGNRIFIKDKDSITLWTVD
jgi:outer membrane protein assembly factor BamB